MPYYWIFKRFMTTLKPILYDISCIGGSIIRKLLTRIQYRCTFAVRIFYNRDYQTFIKVTVSTCVN